MAKPMVDREETSRSVVPSAEDLLPKKDIITLLNDIIIEKQGQETLLFMLLINANIQ